MKSIFFCTTIFALLAVAGYANAGPTNAVNNLARRGYGDELNDLEGPENDYGSGAGAINGPGNIYGNGAGAGTVGKPYNDYDGEGDLGYDDDNYGQCRGSAKLCRLKEKHARRRAQREARRGARGSHKGFGGHRASRRRPQLGIYE